MVASIYTDCFTEVYLYGQPIASKVLVTAVYRTGIT